MRTRAAAAVLAIAALSCRMFGAAYAAPGLDGTVIKKGESSDNVILLQMRLRDLGFYNYKVTGFFGDFTGEALKDFQKENGISADGVAGEQTINSLYDNAAKRKPIEPLDKPNAPAKKANVKSGAYVSWSAVNQLWKIGMRCKVIDYDTGISYYMVRVNESYSVGHADVAPATKTDTKKLKQSYGGSLNAYRRALVVVIGGQRIAASLYGVPHGSTGIRGNGMTDPADGSVAQVCIHFRNSRNNVHDMVDPAHQYQVKRAAGMKPSGPAPGLVWPGD